MPDSVKEVGCIHTCQGLELDYVGVIVGPDLAYKNGQVITNSRQRARTDKSLNGFGQLMRTDPSEAQARTDLIIKNTYRTLMTRGMKGCYVYCVDRALGEFFESRIQNEIAFGPVKADPVAEEIRKTVEAMDAKHLKSPDDRH